MAGHDLELIDVGKVFDGGAPAVEHFSLAVARGEFIALLGPSGCGKTTTLRMIAGFETITGGDLLIRGRHMNDVPPERRPTSMIFQNYALFPHMSVRRNVAYGLDVKRMRRAERDAKVDRILERLGILDIAEQRPDRLSGGQRQRIALARGLVVEPDILLLDEPLGALDANLRKTIQAELKLLQRNLGITFVFVTHAQSEALTMSDRVVVMNQGLIEQIATPLDLYTRPRTPFVARFVGRNTIVAGTLDVADDGIGRVATEFGQLSGAVAHAPAAGAAVRVVVPSEAFELHPGAHTDTDALARAYGGNVVRGTVERRDVVGHLTQMAIRLAGGQLVRLDGHVDAFAATPFEPASDIYLTWQPRDATVIAA